MSNSDDFACNFTDWSRRPEVIPEERIKRFREPFERDRRKPKTYEYIEGNCFCRPAAIRAILAFAAMLFVGVFSLAVAIG